MNQSGEQPKSPETPSAGTGTQGAGSQGPPAGPGSSSASPGSGSGTGSDAAGARGLEDMSIGELAFEGTDRATVLFREEIELAKTEVSEKFNRLVRGSVVGVAAGIFAVLALILLMHAVAWGLNSAFFGSSFWAGFLIEGFIFILVAVGAGLFARRSFQTSAPPLPEMAIEQAREIKSDFEGSRSTSGEAKS
ncbi:MAG: phage holin family protein [bacterium]